MVPPIEVFSNLTVLLHRLALNFHDQTVPLEAWSAKGQTPSRFLRFLSFHVLTEALLEFSSSFFIDEFRLYFHLTWNHRTNFSWNSEMLSWNLIIFLNMFFICEESSVCWSLSFLMTNWFYKTPWCSGKSLK